MFIEERRKEKWQDYTATTLWMIGKSIARETWKLTPYMEYAYPARFVDSRTPEEIKQDIIKRLVG